MGKAKKGKPKPHKVSLTGLQSINDEIMDENPGPIEGILQQLLSPSSDEKMCGLQALSMLCQKEHNIQMIVNSEIVRITAPLLVDPDENIRHASAAALRNLSAVSVEICESLVEQDLFTPLLILLNQYVNEWVPTKEKRANQLDQKSDTFLQAVNIVWNLCESTSKALECFNQSHLLQSFVRCLNYEIFGMDIAITIAQCLLVISEDNSASWEIFSNCSTDLQSLLKIDGDYQSVILRTCVAGIISNVPVLLMQNLTVIIESLSRTIAINHRTVLNEITSKLPLNAESKSLHSNIEVIDEEMLEESDADASLRRLKEELPSELEQELKLVEYLLSAQRISAEVLSNICTPDDEDIDVDDKSDAESVQDYDFEQYQNGNRLSADKIPLEVAESIKEHQIVEKLWERAQPIPENVNNILADAHKNIHKRQKLLRISSLLCLQNFCNCMTIDDLGGSKALYDVWLDLGQQIFQTNQDSETTAALSSLMRATLEHLKTSPALFEQVADHDLQLILDGVRDCSHSEITANWLKMLGTLGCLLKEPMVKKITDFILEVALKETDVWTMSEALDSFMDMFSDNDWNQIVYDLNVVSKSRELEKILKTKVRQQKRELGDRYTTIITVKNNLSRFCKYLETQQKNFIPVHN